MCNDEDEAYFEALEEILQDADARSAELDSELQTAIETNDPEEVAETFRSALRDTQDTGEDILDRAGELEPPEEAAAAHQELLDAVGNSVDFLETTSADQVLASIIAGDTSAIDDISEPIRVACDSLQELASDSGAEVDLKCGG